MISDAYNLQGLISEGKANQYNLRECSTLIQIGNNVVVGGGCVFDKYIDFIQNETVTVSLTAQEQVEYKYRPKRLSLYLYNTEELWYLLLKLNNVSSEIEFKPKKVKVLHPDKLSILNQILIVSDDEITKNHTEIETK